MASYKQYQQYGFKKKNSLILERLDSLKTAIDNMPSGGDLHEYISDNLTSTYGPVSLLKYPYETIKLSSSATGSGNGFSKIGGLPEKLTVELTNDSYTTMASIFDTMPGCKELYFKTTSGNTISFTAASAVRMMFYVARDLEVLDLSCFDFTGITSKPDRMCDRVGQSHSSTPTIVYVKDVANQEWLLANGGGPSNWSTANVIVKE